MCSFSKLGEQRTFIYTIIVVAFVLLFQEIIFRIVFPLPEVSNFNRASYAWVTPFHKNYASNLSFRWTSEPDKINFIHDLNLYGFRTENNWRVKKESDRERIAIVGDSFVEGMSASVEETITEGFRRAGEEAKSTGKHPEIMNFGMASANSPHYLKLIRDMVPLFRPDTLILVLYANDFPAPEFEAKWIEDNYQPRFNNYWLPQAYYVISALLRGERVPRRWHPTPIPWFQPVSNPSHFLNGKSDEELSFIRPDLRKAMEQGTMNPWLADHLNGVESKLKMPGNAEPYLSSLATFLKKYGVTLRIVYLPHNLQVSDYYVQFQQKYSKPNGIRSLMGLEYQRQAKEVANITQRLNIPFLDFTSFLREEEAKGRHWYCDYDNHMRGPQYLRIGRMIQEWVSERK
jgi:hypothetical protein